MCDEPSGNIVHLFAPPPAARRIVSDDWTVSHDGFDVNVRDDLMFADEAELALVPPD